jgi:iron complex transport system ATP-binding protein
VIRAEGLCFRAGAARLVEEVSLEIRPGRMIALVGPNGAGKSTLLRMLAGELRPSAGRVSLDGRAFADWNAAALARRRAVVAQASQVDFPMSATEIVALGRIPHAGRCDRARHESLVWQALVAADAGGLAARAYATLSGGEQQRVQFARALAQILDSPEDAYLLLDEPTASLDIAHQAQILRAARRLADLGAGVFVVLHDLNLAAAHADAVAMLSRGRIVALGAPDEVLTAERVETVYDWPVTRFVPPGATRPVIIPSA